MNNHKKDKTPARPFWLFYSRSEKVGIGLLTLLIIFFAFLPSIWVKLFPTEPFKFPDLARVNPTNDSARIREWRQVDDEKTLFSFDPNIVDREDLLDLGFSKRLADNLIRYREKGGVYRKKEDLLKLWGMDTAFYLRLEPWIHLEAIAGTTSSSNAPSHFQTPNANSQTNRPSSIIRIDINGADSLEWIKLKGIGPTFAKRILSFREKLGGFARVTQLKEVFGLDSNWVKSGIENGWFSLGHGVYRKISINKANKEQLAAHPYLTPNQARVIIAYRAQHGSFTNSSELIRVKVLNKEQIDKIVPYITFDQ